MSFSFQLYALLCNNNVKQTFADSAGGTGVLLNVDRVAELLEGLGHTGVQVRGLSDSGWFLDNKQNHFTDCVDNVSCAPTETIKRAIKYVPKMKGEKLTPVCLD